MLRSFSDIDNQIKTKGCAEKRIIAVAAANEGYILSAVFEAHELGLIDAILVGNKQDIMNTASEHQINIKDFTVIDCDNTTDAAKKAVELVRKGRAHILMKGLLDTSVYLKAVLDKQNGIRSSMLLSFVSVFEVEGFERLMLITDPAINMEPGLEEKETIMLNAVSLAKALGYCCPKVAFICPIEKVHPKMESTQHAKVLTEKYSGRDDFSVYGPFGLDNAINEEAARIKGLDNSVAGKADILIVHDLGVGNAIYKSLVFFGHMKNAGIVIGAKAPVLLTSRADSAQTKLNSIKLGILLADSYQNL